MNKDTKEIILQKALELFSKKGFDACSMNEIAAAAKVNKATIYYYYNGKDRIYDAVLIHVLDSFYNRLSTNVAKAQGANEKLRAYIYAFGENFKHTRKMAPLMLRELASSGKNLSNEVQKILFRNTSLLNEIVDLGHTQGIFKRQEIFPLYLMIVGTMNMYVASNRLRKKTTSQSALSGLDLNLTELANYILDVIREGIEND